MRLPGEEGRLYTLRQCVWIELFQDKRSQIGTTSAPADLDEAPPIAGRVNVGTAGPYS